MTTSFSEYKQAAVSCTLRNSHVFAGIAPCDLAAVADITVIKSVPKSTYLFREGDPSAGFFIVQAGAISVHRVNAAGKEMVIHVFRAGESFAEATLANDRGYLGDARAVESSQVLLVQKAGFLALLKRQPELAMRMLGSVSAHVRVLVGQLEDLTLKDVESRLANWLLKRCPDRSSHNPAEVLLPTTKRVLASELGTVSETFSRTLAKLREQELVFVNGKSITVLDPSGLSALVRRNLGE